LYQAHCASCHGDHTGGGLIVKTLSGYPSALLTTKKLKKSTQEEFSKIVIGGIPGESMPAHAELTDRELKELYLYINDNLQ
jgi:mono/diheme cytochrome c family protein